MKQWPVPESNQRVLPVSGNRGSFWEDRGDRHHAGVDIYAPEKSNVLAIEDGKVIEVKEFTSPAKINYWNITYSILVQNRDGVILRYAELGDALVKSGQEIKAGEVIGHVGLVLNPEKINSESPLYIQKLKAAGNASMLHFEMHSKLPGEEDNYLGGNYFCPQKPDHLLDPTSYLQAIDK